MLDEYIKRLENVGYKVFYSEDYRTNSIIFMVEKGTIRISKKVSFFDFPINPFEAEFVARMIITNLVNRFERYEINERRIERFDQ